MTARDHEFSVSVRHAGSADIVEARGELDIFSAPQLREVLSGAGPCKARHLVLDLSTLGFLDSVGIGTIIAGRRLCAARGGRTVLVAREGTAVHKILHILGLHQVMEIAPSLEAATGSIDEGPGRRDAVVGTSPGP